MTEVSERLWRRVVKQSDGCWIWTGATVKGYGYIGRGRRGEGNVLTHRLAYELLVGPIPDGLDLDHLCLVPRCCNPAHLEPVTRSENAIRQGRVRTHCKRGHEFTPENTAIRHQGWRSCRTCRRARDREAA